MSNAKTYDFSSVGDTLPTLRSHEKAAAETITVNFNPRTPLQLSNNKSELFVMNTDLASAVSDNMKNLLLTNRGERVMQPDFGANLKAILSEFGTTGFESEVMRRIKTSVSKYFSYVTLLNMTLEKVETPPEQGLVVVNVGISYSITNTQGEQQITVTLSTVA